MNKLYIMCAIPGAGKDWWIERNLPNTLVCSADHEFIENGVYRFVPSKIGQAHENTQKKACVAMMLGSSDVVISNTNLATWQMKNYLQFAKESNYEVEIIRISVDPDVAFARQQHNVPKEHHNKMVALFDKRDLPEGIAVREVSN